jgi:nicotinamidase-related amidase
MPVTSLDPKTALIVIDLQKGIIAMAAKAAHPVEPVIANCVTLVEAFRAKSLPVFLVHVLPAAGARVDQPRPSQTLPPDFAEFIPELNVQPTDHVIIKHSWGAFANRNLATQLESFGVTQVVIVGVSTSVGVESTARQAQGFGLNITLATDAMTDMNLDAHTNSLTRIFPRLAETGTTAEILALLS